jgi:pyrimidine operon attenuation protein / uracil phosphoribosyltransferase
MSDTMTLVLNHKQINRKITRMAYEIYERNNEEKEVIFAGITGMGMILANLLSESLKRISDIQVHTIEIHLDKNSVAENPITLSDSVMLADKVIVVVDDVLNTGKTLVYALFPFLQGQAKKIEVAVLVNRSHTRYPVTPDYTGLELATTLSEHITIDLSKDNFTAHLH